jgi:hypothetical protein
MRQSGSRQLSKYLRLALAPLVLGLACRVHVPERPEELREGTFALTFRGVVGRQHVPLNESVEGTACRASNYILLDSRKPPRVLSVRFPEAPGVLTRYPLALRGHVDAASGVVNLPVKFNQGASLHMIDGAATIMKSSPDDVIGNFEARLAQVILDGPVKPESAYVHGVFRAKRCDYWLRAARDAARAP